MNELPFFMSAEQSATGSGSLPDSNTSEAILYGKAYAWVKSALWVWDEMEDYLMRKADSLEGQLMDRDWCYRVMRHNRYLIYARSPPVNDPNKLRDLFTLHDLCKCMAGIHKIEEYRRHNKAWARMQGVQQYVEGMAGRGVSESEWKAATASYNMEPITYDYVHGVVPSMMPGEYIDWDEAMKDLMGGKEYDALVRRIFGIDVSGATDAHEPEAPEVLGDDAQEEEQADDPFFDGFAEDLEQVFCIASERLSTVLQEEDDEFTHAAEFWMEMDVDNRGIIDRLIGFAEAMP